MYCDRCGTQLGAGVQFCTSCGKAVAPGATMPGTVPEISPPAEGRVRRHIHRLATLWVVNGVLRLIAVTGFLLFGRMFFPGWRGWGPVVWPFGRWGLDLPGGFLPLGIFLGFFGVLHLVLAWGLFERQPWARMLGLVLGILALIRFPLGTALGIYTLWVLGPEDSAREYDRLVHATGQLNGAGFSPSGTR